MNAGERENLELAQVKGRRLPVVVRVAGWERHSWLRAGFSTRARGASSVYGEGELNVGWTMEDDPAAVAQNRAAFVREVALDAPMSLVTVGQVHGSKVWTTDKVVPPLMTKEGRARLEGDGLISRTPGELLAILTADCVPVLIADTRLRVVGAFHAGWRGTAARIAEQGVDLMREHYGSRTEDLLAAIGPCIGACCFEVGPEVRNAFQREFTYGSELFSAQVGQKWRLDLVEANRRQLTAGGVPAAAIWASGECTACARDRDGQRRFFSFRNEGGVTGRMLSAIGVVG